MSDESRQHRDVIPLTYDTAIQKHLKPGEKLLWVGRPRQGWAFRWQNRLLMFQLLWAGITLWGLFKMICWSSWQLGIQFAPAMGPPTTLMSLVIIVGAAVAVWQLVMDKKRRAGTWYGLTDQRLLFVLTSVTPESVIGVEYNEIDKVYWDQQNEAILPAKNTLTIRLKQIDPYVAGSTVLAYLLSPREIVLENLPNGKELFDLVRKRGRELAETS